MVDPAQTAAILKRALAYPYATPGDSYLYRDGTVAPELELGDFLRGCVERGGLKLP